MPICFKPLTYHIDHKGYFNTKTSFYQNTDFAFVYQVFKLPKKK